METQHPQYLVIVQEIPEDTKLYILRPDPETASALDSANNCFVGETDEDNDHKAQIAMLALEGLEASETPFDIDGDCRVITTGFTTDFFM
jgi:hypothetical protein